MREYSPACNPRLRYIISNALNDILQPWIDLAFSTRRFLQLQLDVPVNSLSYTEYTRGFQLQTRVLHQERKGGLRHTPPGNSRLNFSRGSRLGGRR